ncbi:MAG: macro domain-containing protein [Calditrichaeota bacterium]|nr:macro domain-containing protein [Calditrichota bacterium]
MIKINNSTIELIRGDITEMETDAIVNAANEHLAHGGGVAGAIVRKGGSVIQKESNDWVREKGIVKTGSAAITSGGNLKAGYVIHAVGPIMGSGDEDNKLKSATASALQLAEKHALKSVAFPAISTGIFGYPVERCAKVMLESAIEHAKNNALPEKIIFCLWDKHAFEIFQNTLENIAKSDS